MKVLKHTEFPFPDDLEGRMNSISNVVNSEIKIATLLHLDDTLAEGGDILSRIRNTVGKKVKLGWGRDLASYCHHSLLPIGAVAEEEIRRYTGETTYLGYRLTESGKKYGIPIAVFSLRWGVDNGFNLYSIFGSTNSPGKSRSPLNRIKILKMLRSKGKIRKTDLVDNLELAAWGLRSHLKSLKKIGFIAYDPIPEFHEMKGRLSYYKYSGKKGTPETVRHMRDVTLKALKAMKKLKTGSYLDVANEIDYRSPNISGILAGLERQGFLESIVNFKVGTSLPEVEITDDGRKFVDKYLAIVEDALSDNASLSELQNKAGIFLASETYKECLINGINNHWKVSPHGNSRPVQETNEMIISYFRKKPGARPKEMRKDLNIENLGSYYLKPLVKAGILEKKKIDKNNKTAVGYFVTAP